MISLVKTLDYKIIGLKISYPPPLQNKLGSEMITLIIYRAQIKVFWKQDFVVEFAVIILAFRQEKVCVCGKNNTKAYYKSMKLCCLKVSENRMMKYNWLIKDERRD